MIKQLLKPTALSSAGAVDSLRLSASDVVGNFKFVVNNVDIAVGKTVTVKVQNFNDSVGGTAKDIKTVTITGNAGVTVVEFKPNGSDGEFYSINLTYDNATAINISAVAVYLARYEK